jgi:hypothetical protein
MNASLKRFVWTVPLLLCALVVAMADLTTTQPTTQTMHEPATTTAVASFKTRSASTRPATQPVSVAPVRPPRDFYEPLIRKNIFLKTPGQSGFLSSNYTPLPAQPAPTPTTRASAESSWVVTGTAIGVGNPAALLENSDSGEVRRVKVGDSTPAGYVTVIDAEGINLQSRAGTKRVVVGSSLDGNATPATLPSASSQPEATGDGPSEDSILERLRRRRLKEMGK